MGGAWPAAGAGAVWVGVLGPLRLVVEGHPVEVPGPKRRAVLALLARAEGRSVAVEELLEALWPSELPTKARAALQSHVSRLRGHLGAGAARLETAGDSYRLVLDEDGLDAARARALMHRAEGIAGADPGGACTLLAAARALWRGGALSDLVEVLPLAAWAVSLEELRREVDDRYLSCALAAGHPGEVVGPAREAVAVGPLRERPVLLLMRALAATGRTADALQEGYEFRRRLSRGSGLDPTPTLAGLEREIASGATRPDGAKRIGAPTRLIGRDAEVAALRRLIDHERVVTVVGPGGVGKTSLVQEVARRVDSASVLLLAPVTDPAAVPYTLARTLELQVVHGDAVAACTALLGAGPRMLVIDNCEHLRPAVRDLVSTLTADCPQLSVLATSREPLGLGLERQFRLAPLALPDPRGTGAVERVPSVAVFLDRAHRVRPGPAFGPDQLRLVSAIVRRLDGVPLAIELAAGRLSSLSLADLHARLDRSLDLLGDGGWAGDSRHRTLRATIDWSYQLLADGEQRLFRHLAVFPDGFDLATAERIAAELELSDDPAGVLSRLVDASMIVAQLGDPTRYRMLETLRSYGLDRLTVADELIRAQELLMCWAWELAAWINVTEATAREPEADAALRRELANLRAAWVLARKAGRFGDTLTFVSDLLVAATARDVPEVWGWAKELATDPAAGTHPRRATVLGMAAIAAWQQGGLADADQLARRGLAAAAADDDDGDDDNDDEGRWWSLAALSTADLSRCAFADAIAHAQRAAELAPRPTEHYGIAAIAAAYSGDLDLAWSFNEKLAAVAESQSLRGMHAYVAGEIDNAVGRYDHAEQHYTRAMTLARTAGATFIEGVAAVGLVSVRASAGRTGEALRGYRELIDYWERTGNWLQQWTTLRNLAWLLHRLGDHEPALLLTAAADAAPDAPAVSEGMGWGTPTAPLPADTAARVREEGGAASRAQVVDVARRAVDDHLARHGPAVPS